MVSRAIDYDAPWILAGSLQRYNLEGIIEAGGSVSGFNDNRWKTVQQIRVGDYLLCYLTGISRFVGVLEVVTAAYKDNTKVIWKDAAYPCRLGVKAVEILSPDVAVPILELKDNLSIFDSEKGSSSWTAYVRGSPTKWKDSDGENVVQAILDAKRHPISRPFDAKKLARRPFAQNSGLVLTFRERATG